MIPAQAITGLLLAGGEGRRMGYADKGLLLLRGRPLAAHVAERLAPQVGGLLVSANRNAEAHTRLGWPVIADRIAGVGPLGGLHAGLAACTTPWLLAAPCDAPLLPADLAARLAAAASQAGALAAAPVADGRFQAAFVLCHRDCLAALESYLAATERKMETWLRQLPAVEVPFADAGAFANINTPEALAALDADH